MHALYLGTVYTLFLLSGAAALIYQVVWMRSLSLVFGGTHLAVTTVLAVFMGGLALGSHLIGPVADRVKRPLRLYGYLEIGIAFSALLFIGLMVVYPPFYGALAQGRDDHRLFLSLIRIVFASFALILPATLMGATLPLLTRYVSHSMTTAGERLSALYGLNTLGAVIGAAAAGFYLLPFHSVSVALSTAVALNLFVGSVSLLLRGRPAPKPDAAGAQEGTAGAGSVGTTMAGARVPAAALPARLVLVGIGVSGFCALGYEVLWTRILTLTIGTSVYGFTIMLIAFLAGIALGSEAFGLALKRSPWLRDAANRQIVLFGAVQCLIGLSALLVTVHIRDLPLHALSLRGWFMSTGLNDFQARQWANLVIAFSAMLVPAFCMGFAFPLAGSITARSRDRIGRAVGNVLSVNTVGAILGSAVSGFLLIYLFGIERSLQMLTVVNIGFGLVVVAGLHRSRKPAGVAALLATALLLFLALDQNALKAWDTKYFAVFRNNQPEAFDTQEKVRDAVENTDVLYYDEGVNSTISVVQVKGGDQAVLVNGKVVASNTLQDQQCQLTLGHLPMLLHRDPKKVLVVGLGTGMTLGAVSVHRGIEDLTLVEMEPHVVPAARTFANHNNRVLDDPKLRIVFNDGRNYLMTTKERYDVITADPIHPWTQGSGYLYTTEYFRLASQRLRPGGIMCQWLPIYEMRIEDLRSVVRTFSENFRYTMAWMTYYDAEIIGSNAPIVIDEVSLSRRIAEPAVATNLERVMMGSATDFLSYFIMGDRGMRQFGKNGVINSDDNLYLEFSAPLSIADASLMGRNVTALFAARENILPYLQPAEGPAARSAQLRRWGKAQRPIDLTGMAHARFLSGGRNSREFLDAAEELDRVSPDFAPWRFLRDVKLAGMLPDPTLIGSASLPMVREGKGPAEVVVSAVLVPVTKDRVSVMFVDNERRTVYGQLYLSGADREPAVRRFAETVLKDIRGRYHRVAAAARETGLLVPREGAVQRMIEQTVGRNVQEQRGS